MKLLVMILLISFGSHLALARMPASVTPNNGTPVVDKEETPLEKLTDAELRFRIKNRIYPGGKDEEILKVQSQLIAPTRKMAPVTEAPAEPEEPQETETQATD